MTEMTALLSSIYRHGIWIGFLAFVVSVYLLAHCISGVIRTERRARLFSVPLVESQEVELAEAGPVVLAMEGPILSRRFARLEYELVGPDGAPVSMRSVLFRARTTGFTKATMTLKELEIATPGRHLFRIHGLDGSRPGDAECSMVFMRPHLATTMGYVLGIVFSSMVAIASLVLFLLRIAQGRTG
jgi:hypothetical protein